MNDQAVMSTSWKRGSSSTSRNVLARHNSQCLLLDLQERSYWQQQSVIEAHRDPTADEFRKLAEEWRSQKGPISSTSQIVMIPAYQKIISMGKRVVPFILEELWNKPDHWFWALEVLTGANPVLENERGNIRKMTAAWLEWGRREGYLRDVSRS